ncbi:MAG: PAS domain S-box protein [Scytonematopsis contorta HA4267-MV1]|jgi:PAS domain S-box-containing protein|nr:PAS domain S-box protein [Scytonematopsis contorta HA4267-MV1]
MKSLFFYDEAARLEALQQYQILDTSPEEAFDDLASLAAQVCNTPIALINFITANRQWFKAKVGLNLEEASTSIGFCPICMESGEVLIIPDTLADERYALSPIVTSEPYVRFYAGVPLKVPSGQIVGTICVVDKVPRQITPQQVEALQSISRQVTRQLEIRRNLAELAIIQNEYKQSQQALQESECTLRSFFDNVPMMMGVVELHSEGISHISDNAAKGKFLSNIPEIGQNRFGYSTFLPQTYVRDWMPYYHQAQRTKLPVSFEYLHETLEDKRWLRATVSSISTCCFEGAGRFAYVVEDITERKEAEKQLHWKEALLRSMTSVSPLAFYVVDNCTNDILYFNESFCKIWGIEHLKEGMENGELKHQDVLSECLLEVEDIPTFLESSQPLHHPENRAVIEDEVIFNDGRIIRRFSTQVRDENDKYFGRLYIFEDITVRKKSEHQLREQAALLDVTTDAIIVRDLHNNIVLWNKSAEKLYGWKSEEAIGNNANKLLYKKFIPKNLEIYRHVLKHGYWQGELQKVNKLGKEIIVESCWTLVRDEYKHPKSILVVDSDISEKKRLEQQVLRTQRTESIGTLASGIAHDLNNVLSPILMSVQVLQAKTTDERSQQMLSIVENNAKRGANLVKQVLSYVRGIEGERSVLNVKQLIAEMKQIVEQTFPKSITVDTVIQPDLLPICGDGTQIHQVLMNLCLNARDAMSMSGNLTISAENCLIDENYARMNLDAKAGSYIVLAVSDTGNGIPQEIVDRIFEPFFTTKEFGKGTGLGLSTVMGIIKGHGGFITVSSCIGKGTTFKVYLPTVETSVTFAVKNEEIFPGNGECILVVDDEASILEISKTTLESYNYQVITASDGIEAIALYAQNKDKIHAAIIDMMMPDMDGAVTITTLQKMNPLLKIIAVSGLTTSEQVPFYQESKSSLNYFLPKPYTAIQLLEKLNGVLRGFSK